MWFLRLRRKKKKPAVRRRQLKRELLKIDGHDVEVILRSDPRARRYIVKVDPATAEVTVVTPAARSFSGALAFARTEREWIAERLAKVTPPVALKLGGKILFRGVEHIILPGEKGEGPVWIDQSAATPTIRVSGQPEHAVRRVNDWLKREARRYIDEAVTRYTAKLGVKAKSITIRDMISRWGSCSTERCMSFSWRLVLAPPFVLDYVVAHEASHMREMNHHPRFWRLVESIMPESDAAQAWLAEHGARLHRYAPRQRPALQAA